MAVMHKMRIAQQELVLIREAIDSHVYWQLSDEHYRHDGYVREPGSDDVDKAGEIAAAWALLRRLESALPDAPGAEEG